MFQGRSNKIQEIKHIYNETIQPPETNGAIFWLGDNGLNVLNTKKSPTPYLFRGNPLITGRAGKIHWSARHGEQQEEILTASNVNY